MFRSILVPLDGSAPSEQALDLAVWIAQRAGAAVRLCHVREPSEPGPPEPKVEDETAVLSHFEEYLGVLARRSTRELGRPVSSRVVVGAPAARVIQLAHEAESDLIVMTTHGHGGVSHAWIGATAEGIARQAGTPVVLLRPAMTEAPGRFAIRRILVALDGSPGAEFALPAAAEVARLCGAALHLLSVVELPVELPSTSTSREPVRLSGVEDPAAWRARVRTYLDRVAERLREQQLDVDVDVREAISPATAILQEAADCAADAIAMATHGRSRLRRKTVGSVFDKVIRAAAVPVLLVPSRETDASPSRPRAAAMAGASAARTSPKEP
jgi:nucleotide-binding universal stress UspA family protein